MKRRSLHKLVVLSLSLNAAMVALLLANGLRSPDILSAAWAQTPQPAAPREIIVSPGQLATNQWGCYVLDTRANTLCVYQYYPGERLLRLQASRAIAQDLQLSNFNTSPPPAEVADLVEKERLLSGGRPATMPSTMPSSPAIQ